MQSRRRAVYRDALARLREAGLAYPCACTRRDVESAQSAPHDGEQLRYPGTCRGRFAGWDEAMRFKGSEPCWRFLVPEGTRVRLVDAFSGPFEQDVAATLGDFPLARDRDGAGYTLACVADDLLMGVTEVVRGDDLLPATPAQVLLARALSPDAEAVSFLHVPLVVGPDGRRLAKRHGDTRIAALRAAGARPEEVVGALAASCGWAEPGEAVALRDLLPRFDLSLVPRRPWTPPPSLRL